MRNFIEQSIGVKPPFTQAAFFEMVAASIFLVTGFWPRLSLATLIHGLLIGGVWAIYGFLSYLRALGQSPRS